VVLTRKNVLRLLAVVAMLLLVATACSKKTSTTTPGTSGTGPTGTTGSSGPKPTVKIGFIGALSGDYKLLVVPGEQAAQMAFDQANAAGDLPVTIELVPEDSQGDPSQAAPLAQKLASDDSVVGVIGPAFSGESAAVGDTLDQAGIPFITQSATDDALSTHGWTHWFRALGNNSSQAVPESQYIEKKANPNCVFVASDGSAYGKGLADIALSTLEKDGVKLAGKQETIDPNSKDFSALVTKIKSSGCNSVFFGGYSPQAGLIKKQAVQGGLQNVTFVSGDGVKDDTFLSTAGSAGDGYIAGCGCADVNSSTDPTTQTFVKDFTAKYGQAPGIYAAEGWDVAQIYIAAMKAGNTDRASITSFIQGLNAFQGLTKTYTFQSNGELDPASVTTYFYEDQNQAWKLLGTSQDLLG
jgi:branched-chain amino acid transport system substrate-binding protein